MRLQTCQSRSRWRPDAQEYYGSIIRVGNSVSEAYPKRCCDDWKPPLQLGIERPNTASISAAGRPSNLCRASRDRKIQNKREALVVNSLKLTVTQSVNPAKTQIPINNESRWVIKDPAGLRVSRILPYPIV